MKKYTIKHAQNIKNFILFTAVLYYFDTVRGKDF